MANPVCEVLVTNDPLIALPVDVDLACGALVDFQGIVRGLEESREIDGIEYEAHEAMAEHQMKLVAEEATRKFVVASVVLHHRVGFVRAGETSLWLSVRGGHRAAAFAASEWIVDELKRRVPIWKRPRFKIDHEVADRKSAVSV